MSNYERAALQAVIGQRLDGQFQKLLSDYERPIQKKLFELKRKCAETEKISPDLTEKDFVPLRQSDDLEYLYTCAEQDLIDKVQVHSFTRKSLQAAQLQHGYVGASNDRSVVQSVLLLLVMVLGESLLNSAFFSNAHMVSGPAAALLTSFLISMTNVAASACAGFFIGRYLNYGSNALGSDDAYFRKKRTKAKYQFTAFIALIVFFHLTVGLVRAQESIEAVSHSPLAYLQMAQTPEAIFLILMGGCMSVIAFHKGIHSFDCPYPEIGSLQRAEAAAKDDIQDALDYYQEEITAYFEDAEKEINSPIASQKKKVEQFNKAVSSCQEARRNLEQSVRDAETNCRGELAELITTYRCISGEDQEIPIESLQRMVSFDKYLDIEIPAFCSPPEIVSQKSELLLEKNRAVNRLTTLFQSATKPAGGQS
ncbi:MAG: hypothetical protein KUG81_01495 [Gammaproteobacteria bacterium]|nr:hypothetical protein [Gammaproteobacteria bacterium]